MVWSVALTLVAPLASVALAAPPAVTVDATTSSRVELAWPPVAGATAVRVYLGAEPPAAPGAALPDQVLRATLPGAATSHVLSGLAAAVDVFARVEADTPSGTEATNVHARTRGGPRASLDTPLREVHLMAPDVLEVVLADPDVLGGAGANDDGPAWAAGPWTVVRRDGTAIPVVQAWRRTIPVGAPDYQIGYNAPNSNNVIDADHHVYLKLAVPVGRRDVLSVTGPLGLAFTLPYSDLYLETPVIQVNQVGYNPRATQRWAYVSAWLGDGGGLALDGFPATAAVLEELPDPMAPRPLRVAGLAVTARSALDADCACPVKQVDLASVPAAEGVRYRVHVPGVGVSWPTAVSEEAAFKAFYVVARGLFHNRWAGDLALESTEWSRPVDHVTRPDGTPSVYTGNLSWIDEQGATRMNPQSLPLLGARQVVGGHHDAGDFDLRSMHTSVGGFLLRAVELAGPSLLDGQLTLPESGNGIPDLLDEALWSLAGWQALQEADGGIRAGVESWREPDGIYPAHQDPLPYWTFAEDAEVSARVAGLFAQAARLVEPHDAAWATDLRARAVAAYGHAVAGGASDAFMTWAAGELYRLTGEASYKARFEAAWNALDVDGNGAYDSMIYDHLQPGDYAVPERAMPDMTLGYLGAPGAVASFVDRAIAKLDQEAAIRVGQAQSAHAHRNPRGVGASLQWGRGVAMAKYLDPVFARLQLPRLDAASRQQYFDVISLSADYVLGGNPLGQSLITGLGSRSPQDALYLDSLTFQKAGRPPIPGIPVFGPVDGLPFVGYSAPASSVFSPGNAALPPYFRYGDVRTMVTTNEFTAWETQAPTVEMLALLLGGPRGPPASWLPGGFDHANPMPSFGPPSNRAPVVQAGPDQLLLAPDMTADLAGKVVDDGFTGQLALQWSRVSGPGTVSFAEPTARATTATFSLDGVHVLRLVAADGLASVSDDVVITIRDRGKGLFFNGDFESGDLTGWEANAPGVAVVPNTVGGNGAYVLRVTAGDYLYPAFSNRPQRQGSGQRNFGNYALRFRVKWAQQTVRGFDVVVETDTQTPWVTQPVRWSDFSDTAWHDHEVRFNSGTAGAFTLRVEHEGGAGAGRDYYLDDVFVIPEGNQPPLVQVGPDRSLVLPADTLTLVATVTDDGLPAGAAVTTTWTQLAGPGTVVFGDVASLTTSARFPGSGTYVLRLLADDTAATSWDDLEVRVTGGNQPPVARDDAYLATEDTALEVNPATGVLANDSDSNLSDTLTVTLVTPASSGTLALSADGSFTYAPGPDFAGADQFTYLVSDGQVDSEVATVTITVEPVNDAPVAGPEAYAGTQDTLLSVPAPGLLGNDTDVDGGPLQPVLVTPPARGEVTLRPDGSFDYVPNVGATGSDAFAYAASDGAAQSSPVTVSVSLAPRSGLLVLYATTFATDVSADWAMTRASVVVGSGLRITSGWNQYGWAELTGSRRLSQSRLSVEATFQALGTGNGSATEEIAVRTTGATDGVALRVLGNWQSATVQLLDNGVIIDQRASVVGLRSQFATLYVTLDVAGSAATATVYQPAGSGGGQSWSEKTVTLAGTVTRATGPGNVRFCGNAMANTATMSAITVRGPAASSPLARRDTYGGTEDATLVVAASSGLLLNDSDADGDPLTALLVTPPARGALTLQPTGAFTYVPAPDAFGPETFSYAARDGLNTSNVATATIVLAPTNDPPRALPDTYTAQEGIPLGVDAGAGVLANDTDPDGDALLADLVSSPAQGTVTLLSSGAFTYAPAPGARGSDAFTYRVTDGVAWSAPAQVSLTILERDEEPQAMPDAYATGEDVALVVAAAAGVLANDVEPDGTPLAAVLLTPPGRGTLALALDGSFVYTPAANVSGADAFTYAASDGVLTSPPARVDILVAAAPDPPVAVPDAFATAEDASLVVAAASGVLANDTDADGDALSAILVTPPAAGQLALAPDGGFTYAPAPDWNGTATFTYEARDGALSATAVATVVVAPVNDAPVARDDAYAATEDAAFTVVPAMGLLANDTDVDSPSLLVVGVTAPPVGSVSVSLNGSFTYTPRADWNGEDAFTYEVSDGAGGGASARVVLTVAPVPDAPVARDDSFAATEDTPLSVAPLAGVIRNDSDADGDWLTAQLEAAPLVGDVALQGDGSFTYVPDADWNGADRFTYRVSDGGLPSAPATVTVNVAASNDAPVAAADAHAAVEDTPLVVPAAQGVLANDADVDGDALAASLVTAPLGGTLALSPNGSFTYTPAANRNGPDAFTYRATDPQGASATAVVSIVVAPVNDAPVGVADTYTASQDTSLVVNAGSGVLANDVDVDADPLTALLVTPPTRGSVALDASGAFTYVPQSGYVGPDAFTYAPGDGRVQGGAVTVSLTVDPRDRTGLLYQTSFATDVSADWAMTRASVVPGTGLRITNGWNQSGWAELTGARRLLQSTVTVIGTIPAMGTGNGLAHAEVAARTSNATDGVAVRVHGGYDAATVRLWDGSRLLAEQVSFAGLRTQYSTVTVTLVVVGTTATATIAQPAGSGGGQSWSARTIVLTGTLVESTRPGNVRFAGLAFANQPTLSAITVRGPVGAAPVASNDAYAGSEDVPLAVSAAAGVLANDMDADGDVLQAVLITPPSRGALTLQPTGAFTYAPAADWSGAETFAYRATDGTSDSAPATVTLTFAPVNDAPVARLDAYATLEGQALSVGAASGVLANDTDAEGGTLTAALASPPLRGTLTLLPVGSFTYVPQAGFFGQDAFTYVASDGVLPSPPATVTISVTKVNDVPVSQADAYAATEDVTLSVAAGQGVLANDSDGDGDALAAVLVTAPVRGALTLQPSGAFSYVPSANTNGVDTFTYRASDGTADGGPTTVTITVAAVNDAPVGVADAYAATQDTPLVVAAAQGVLANDVDVEAQPLQAVLVSQPARGVLSLASGGGFTYTPGAGLTGADTFTYAASDGSLQSPPVTVTVTVAPREGTGVLYQTGFATDVSADWSLTRAGVVPGTGLRVTSGWGQLGWGELVGSKRVSQLTLTVVGSVGALGTGNSAAWAELAARTTGSADGVMARAHGAWDGAAVRLFDGTQLLTERAAVAGLRTQLAPLTITLETTGTTARATFFQAAGSGGGQSWPEVTVVLTGTITRSTAPGNVRFAGMSYANTPTLQSITVRGPSGVPPVARDDAFTTPEDTPLVVPAGSGVLANDTDADGNPLSAVLVNGPTRGVLSLQSSGAFTYTPNANASGVDTFTYKANDGSFDSPTATVTVTVTPVNDPPVAVPDGYAVTQDTMLVKDAASGVLANDTDVEGSPLSAVLAAGPTRGALTLQPSGSFTYAPNAGFVGTDTFTYRASDGSGQSAPATVTITVNAVRPPILYETDFSTNVSADWATNNSVVEVGGAKVNAGWNLRGWAELTGSKRISQSSVVVTGTLAAMGTGNTGMYGELGARTAGASDGVHVRVFAGWDNAVVRLHDGATQVDARLSVPGLRTQFAPVRVTLTVSGNSATATVYQAAGSGGGQSWGEVTTTLQGTITTSTAPGNVRFAGVSYTLRPTLTSIRVE